MAWTAPATYTTGQIVSAADLNLIRDNLLETAPAKVTAQGDILSASGVNALKRIGAGTSGQFLQTQGAGADPAWANVDGVTTYRLSHTYAIPGEILVPSGDTNYVIPFFVSLAAGQTAKLVKARHRINSGTSVTCKLQRKASGGAAADVTGFTGISVTTTDTDTDPADVDLADNDMLALVVTAVSGTPKNMTVTIFTEHTQ